MTTTSKNETGCSAGTLAIPTTCGVDDAARCRSGEGALRNCTAHCLTAYPLGNRFKRIEPCIPPGSTLRKERSMKILLGVLAHAPEKNDSIHASLARGSGTAETRAWQDERRDGRSVQPCQWPTVAALPVHRPKQSSRHGDANAVLRDGAAGTGPADAGAHPRPDASGGRDCRVGLDRVTATSVSPRACTLRAHLSPFDSLIADALRRAALAPTDREALDIAGGVLATLAQLARAEVRHG